MTREQAITTAAQWWATMIVHKIWDNGDPDSERIHALFRDAMPGPELPDKPAIEAAFRTYFDTLDLSPDTTNRGCYCDYSADWLDSVFHTINPAWDSRFCGPQKAGTQFEVDAAGNITVRAKHGYGQPWQALDGLP